MAGLSWAVVVALASISAATPSPTGRGPSDPATVRHTVRRHYTRHDQQTGRYQYVPIDVPPGSTRLTVQYRYEKAGGASVVDLGLFEPGPLDLGTPAFRGWSGGERESITVSEAAATPGYWPGPLPAGRWNVLLGLYKVSEGGLDVEISYETERGTPSAPPPLAPRRRSTGRKGPAWYAGGLHLHTVHSDGAVSPQEIFRLGKEAGLDFVVITDHNNATHQLEHIDDLGLLWIVGEEVTTPAGHASVWGLDGWREYVDFRLPAGDPRLADLVRLSHAKGTLFSINHPKADCQGCAWTHEVVDGVDGIEIANGGAPERQAALAMWDSLLQGGRRIVGVGASDWHRGPRPIDVPCVRVRADELSESAVLDGIRLGRVVVMADARTPAPDLIVRVPGRGARVGDTLAVARGATVGLELGVADAPVFAGGVVEFFWNGVRVGTAPVVPGQRSRISHAVDAPGYIRAHINAADGSPIAITNPIWVTRAEAP